MHRVTIEEFVACLDEANSKLKRCSDFDCMLCVNDYTSPILSFRFEGHRPMTLYSTDDLTDMYHYIKGMISGIDII